MVSNPSEAKPSVPFSVCPGVLNLGGVEIDCHVLNDGRRVLSRRDAVKALTERGRESGNLTPYLRRNPLWNEGLNAGPKIEYHVPPNSSKAIGMEATELIRIAKLYLEADRQGLLHGNQAGMVKRSLVLIMACAEVGITALIDEATGYEKLKPKGELGAKLNFFLAEHLQPWDRTFPQKFFRELARLEGTVFDPHHSPIRYGKFIMANVYDAIDEDLGDELREKNPDPEHGRNHHQHLSLAGKAALERQIVRVMTMMEMCDTLKQYAKLFARQFNREPWQIGLFGI